MDTTFTDNDAAPRQIDDLPDYIKDRYDTFALITGPDALAQIDDSDDVLIVSCDWLLWHELIEQGRHAVYYELGSLWWDKPDNLATDLFIRANDWVLDADTRNDTVFHGVCIGRIFGSEMTMATINYHRITRALVPLIERFTPKTIHFHDFKFDINHLSRNLRLALVQDIAAEYSLDVVDRPASAAADQTDEKGSINATRLQDGHAWWKSLLINTYTTGLEVLSRLRRCLSPNDVRLLLAVNTNMLEPVLGGYQGGKVVPAVIARSVPRRLKLLAHCLKTGVVFVCQKQPKLTDDDHARLGTVLDALREACDNPQTREQRFIARYVHENILHPSVIRNAAEIVLEVEALIDRTKPDRIVVDSIRSRRHVCLTEIAAKLGIDVDYTWHSPLTPQSHKMGPLGGDPRQEVLVTRCLSWGRANELWLKRSATRIPWVRIGSPLHDKYKSKPELTGVADHVPGKKNVLILQYTYTVIDLAGLNSAMYGSFVELVQRLRKAGYEKICFKLHPGPARWEVEQFRRIAEHFNIDCEIKKREPFAQWADWADIVIGPVFSGAMFEVLSAGKPYHAVQIGPAETPDFTYYEDFPVHHTVDSVCEALTTDISQESKNMLDNVYGLSDFESPTKRFWQVMQPDFIAEPETAGHGHN